MAQPAISKWMKKRFLPLGGCIFFGWYRRWWSSPWLGEFYRVDDSGWLMHAELAGFYHGDDTAGVGYGRKTGLGMDKKRPLSLPLP